MMQFLDAHHDRATALAGTYDLSLVALSVFAATLAAYAAIGLTDRFRASVSSADRAGRIGRAIGGSDARNEPIGPRGA